MSASLKQPSPLDLFSSYLIYNSSPYNFPSSYYCGDSPNLKKSLPNNIYIVFVNNIAEIAEKYHYFILWDGVSELEISKMLPHFVYLDGLCGIRISEQNLYQIVEDKENKNVLFPIELLKKLQIDEDIILKKYHV